MPSIIPTIDLAHDSPARQAELIKLALGNVGFFRVVNAGPARQDVEKMFEYSPSSASPWPPKRHTSPDVQVPATPSSCPKLWARVNVITKSKTFSYGKYCADTTQQMPPPFQDSTPGGQEAHQTIKRFYKDCHQVSELLLELFALALQLERTHFKQSHSFGLNTAMSLIHYPALNEAEAKALSTIDIRAGEHKDWGSMTLLFQQPRGQPGLQVHLPSSLIRPDDPQASPESYEWYPAPIPEAHQDEHAGFLVNVGLGMELWSKGAYKATMHRVIFPGEEAGSESVQDRHTIGFFVQPDDHVAFQPILPGGKVDTSTKAITSGELFDMKLQESMERFQKHFAFSGGDEKVKKDVQVENAVVV
ncbi:hypothetical protein L198_04165 [Cryptococcus wingfieldii CBS 7118]|uniref:Isopenicillin N synthase-like Fe(2+) 2OG dioxygenase domain-containing protein n=1 Tax=Cryptococcus wingfieldii CBS 7118 TaxID=1295528 RepID=A0A1E3J939_9TREE|nr:hypothetical protein L198_04165 [Cryptococcus wingfieldii CBS 7118]ODN96451.1 hypothetical protein L198_04165 [Cryptococcus wingfieldii CBS 7118]